MTRPFKPLGAYRSFVNLGDSLSVLARRGALHCRLLPEGIAFIRFSRKQKLPPYSSPALAPDAPAPAALRVSVGRALRFAASNVSVTINLETMEVSVHRPPAAPLQIAFGTADGELAARVSLGESDVIYGLGEKTGWLNKRGRRYVMRNTDVWLENPAGMGNVTDPLYASFPFFIVHNSAGSVGLFVDNPQYASFDFRPDHYGDIRVPADDFNLYVLTGNTLPDVLRQYTSLTGRMPLPALWALGYHQCRWGYASAADIRRVAGELRSRNIPADAVWFDIDYMNGYRVFTWDNGRFPEPARLIRDLAADGLRAVTIVDPGVKVDPDYAIYNEGRRGGHFVRHTNGREYNGNVWPGRSAFPDFHSPRTRGWWADLIRQWLGEYAVGGIWNDMNEPASTDVSGAIESTVHGNGTIPHAAARNTYALHMAGATYDGMLAHDPNSRPFILTRAGYSGIQQAAALWGGDNSAQWEHLAASIPMLLNLGLSGMPFVGVDIGGFGGDTHGELLARWTQAGVFYPFCRNHAAAHTNDHEPWAFGSEIESICRLYISLRYRLLPYFYSVFHNASQSGAPIMRPLSWHFPADAATHNLNDQFMFGDHLMIAPILAPGISARAVYLPKGRWYALDAPTLARHPRRAANSGAFDGPTHILSAAPLNRLPLFARAGAILPMWSLPQHTAQARPNSTQFMLFPGNGGLDFYEDDYLTQAHRRGHYRLTTVRLRQAAGALRVLIAAPKGNFESARRHWQFVAHATPCREVLLDGKRVAFKSSGGAVSVKIANDDSAHELAFVP